MPTVKSADNILGIIMNHSFKSKFVLLLILIPFPSFAYIGPGAGISAIGSLIALLAGFGYVLRGFIWMPLKRMFKKSDNRLNNDSDEHHQESNQQAKTDLAKPPENNIK